MKVQRKTYRARNNKRLHTGTHHINISLLFPRDFNYIYSDRHFMVNKNIIPMLMDD